MDTYDWRRTRIADLEAYLHQDQVAGHFSLGHEQFQRELEGLRERVAQYPDPRKDPIEIKKAERADPVLTAAIATARKTGERVRIRSWTQECHEDDCSTDLMTQYAEPNGTTTTQRIHTY